MKTRKFILANKFVGEPKASNFKLVEEDLPDMKDGEILTEAVWLSVDPYMRIFVEDMPVGSTMIGSQVARILESKNEDFPVGKLVVGNFGWQEKVVADVTTQTPPFPKPYIVPDFYGHPDSLALGILGMPGNTAHFGFTEICKPKVGEVVVVSGAAGAVGSAVGQIAKIKGCKVIGITGSDEKVNWLLDDLAFDNAYNYKTADIAEALKDAAPSGINCYFDNVGGRISSTIINHMRSFGRIAVCGSISSYNMDASKLPEAPILQPAFVAKQLKMEGLFVKRWVDQWMDGINQMLQWVEEGKLTYRETVTEGFENMPKAFIGMLRGENIGKAIVKA